MKYLALQAEQSVALVQVAQSVVQAVQVVSFSLKNPDLQVSHLAAPPAEQVKQLATVQARH